MAGKLKQVAEMGFNSGGGVINWFPGHMVSATRAIRDRLKLADLVIEVRDSRIPLSSANDDLQSVLEHKRRIIALNKKDLANTNIMHRWIKYFDSCKQDCISINAHSRSSVNELLGLAEFKLKEKISREPTLLIMVIGVPNVGKSALINSIHRIATSRFPVEEKAKKRATVGPLPGVTQDISGFKIANKPSIYVLDTPGVLVPSIPDMGRGLKLALTGAVKDSVVGEERIVKYLLSIINIRKTPLNWEKLVNRFERKLQKHMDDSDTIYIQDLVKDVQRALYITFKEFEGDLEKEEALESLIDLQFIALQKAFRIPEKQSENARTMVAKRFLTLFRTGKIGRFILDDLPENV